MSTLVTLGCSFSHGDGCYDFSLGDYEKDYPRFREKNFNNFLKNSIGSNIQDKLGYENFYNYAYPGSSNESQLLLFFQNLPKDDNVTILWQSTFFYRKFNLLNRGILDIGINTEWVAKIIEEKLKSQDERQLEFDEMIEYSLRMNVLYEYCKIRKWKLFVWFWQVNVYDSFIHMFPKFKDIIIPFENPFELKGEYDIQLKDFVSKLPNDFHPNEKGYKMISDSLCDSIDTNNMNFPKPLERIKKKVQVNFLSLDRDSPGNFRENIIEY